MPSLLQTRLKHLMEEKSLRTSELEKLAGLKISAVRNILLGKTKHPKAETLHAIAEVLGCTVAELLGKESPFQEIPNSSEKLEHPNLLLDSVKSFVSRLDKEGGNLTLDQAWLIIKETYTYSLQNDSQKVDERFAKWIFSKQKQS